MESVPCEPTEHLPVDANSRAWGAKSPSRLPVEHVAEAICLTWRILLWETRRNGLVLCYAGNESVMRFDDAGEASKTEEIRL